MTTTTSNADQDQSRCEAADAGPAAASPPREDHWDLFMFGVNDGIN